jgi:23S rRNA pseudouridine1911/1915/1917 synthase
VVVTRERFEVDGDMAGQRLDAWLASTLGVPRSEAQRLVDGGSVLVGGARRRKSHPVAAGDLVEIERPSVTPAKPMPVPFTVRYEDDELAVVAKPAGVVVHPAAGVRESTLVGALALRMPLAPAAGEDRPGVVHRLDRDTSGLLVVAKTDEAYAALTEAIRERRVERRYLALVAGDFALPTGRIEAPVGRHGSDRTRMAVRPDGREASTEFRVLDPMGAACLIEARLGTGRTHQIRVHLAHIGHPVVGDRTYGRTAERLAGQLGLRRPFLHACSLRFEHPRDGRDVFVVEPLPEDLTQALDRARTLWGSDRPAVQPQPGGPEAQEWPGG